jgi:MFS family permease
LSTLTIGYGQLVRQNRNFRNLWLGQIISLLGDWFNLIASAALVATLTESGLAVGTLFVVRMLSPFVVSPVAGVVADRYNRQRILIISDIARFIIVFGFLLVREPQHVWLLYALTILQLGIGGFFFPTHTAFLPDIVSPRELGTANALSSVTWSVMLALGAAIGGLVSGALGIYAAFIIDSITFLLSALFIAQISVNTLQQAAEREQTVTAAVKEYVAGLRYLRRHADILVITLHKAFVTLLTWSGIQVAQVAIAEQIFTLGEGGSISLGLMFAVNGLGTGTGPVSARYLTGDRSRAMRGAITISYLISVIGLGIMATLYSFEIVLLGTLLVGIGGGIIWVYSTQLLLQLLPGHIRGRVLSTEFAFFTLTSAIAAAVTGSALDASLSIAQVLGWTAALTLIPMVLWTLWLIFGKLSQAASKELAGSSVQSSELQTPNSEL